MSLSAVVSHRQCGTSVYDRPKYEDSIQPTKTFMATLRDFEAEYLSSDPEVFLDFLSIKSLKQRYVGSSNSDNGVFCQWNHQVNDDFETFVQEFPIDDNISECFASSDDTIKDFDGTVSENDFNVSRKLNRKSEKEVRSKVSEAVNNIEKKLAEGRIIKGGTNFFRRKGKQSSMPKKSLSFDDLRMKGTRGNPETKSPFRRCRVRQDPVPNQKAESTPSTVCKKDTSAKSNPGQKTQSGLDQGEKENLFQGREFHREPLKSCLRNGEANGEPSDLRLIKARPLAPDKPPTGNLKLRHTNSAGIVGHRVLRKALRDSTKKKTMVSTEKQLSSVCMACRDLKLTEIGSTTAHSAAYMGHLQCLQALVESAADITAVNHDGVQPSQVALSTGHFDCWNYLTVAQLSHVLLRELCNYSSLIEKISGQFESVRTEIVKVKQCLGKRSQDLTNQVQCLLELSASISRNLVTFPSSKQKCLGHAGSMYQDVQDSLTLLERIDRKLNDMHHTVTGSESFSDLEIAVQKTEDLLLNDVHLNDIRQLENVQKRNRVIRNFLIEDEQRLNSRLHDTYTESVSSESVVSRGSRVRQLSSSSSSAARAAIVEPVAHSIASTSSSQFNSLERRRKADNRKHHRNHHPHRHKQPNPDISKLPAGPSTHPQTVNLEYRRRHRSRSASSRHSKLRPNGHSESGRLRRSFSSSGSSVSLSCSGESDAESSDWETTSHGSTGTLNVNSDFSEEGGRVADEAHKTGVNPSANRIAANPGPSSSEWNFLRSAIQTDKLRAKNRDSLSQSSLEVCIGHADRASSVSSLRQHRLANHFLHIEKDAKQKSKLIERVIKGEDDSHETMSSISSKRYNQGKNKRTNSYNSHTGTFSNSNVDSSPVVTKPREGPFSSASSSSPSSSRRTVIRNSALDDLKATRLKAPTNFCNTNALREELIGRCRQVPIDIQSPLQPTGNFQNSFHEKPWYDVSDDETSVCTWTNEMSAYDSESSFYQ